MNHATFLAREKYSWHTQILKIVNLVKDTVDQTIFATDIYNEFIKSPTTESKPYANDKRLDGKQFPELLNKIAVLMQLRGCDSFDGIFDLNYDDIYQQIESAKKIVERIENERLNNIHCLYCNGHGQIGTCDEDGLRTWPCFVCDGKKWIPNDPTRANGWKLCMLCTQDLCTDSDRRTDYETDHPDYCYRIHGRPDKQPTFQQPKWCEKFSPNKYTKPTET